MNSPNSKTLSRRHVLQAMGVAGGAALIGRLPGFAAESPSSSAGGGTPSGPKSTSLGPVRQMNAASFENPDHVAIVIHNYRWRLGLADGEARYDDLERRLAQAPTIGVATITLEGDANGAPHGDPSTHRDKFTGRYEHRLVGRGVGHNLPQEAPRDFAQAVLDAGSM